MNRTIAGVTVVAATALATVVAGCASAPRTEPGAGPSLSTGRPGAVHPGPGGIAVTACPARQPGSVRATAGSPTSMTPQHPTGATVCRYEGAGDPNEGTLAKQVNVGAAKAGELAAAFNGSKVMPSGAVYSCPNDTGVVDLVLFDYAQGRHTVVTMSLSGCRTATNGHRIVFYPQRLGTEVNALTGTS